MSSRAVIKANAQINPAEIFRLMMFELLTFLFVNLFRRLQLRLGDFEAAIFDRAEKARLITFVARRAGLLDLDEQHVAVAIERDVLDGLRVAALLALHPEFLARAAPEIRLAGGDGFFQRRAVHPREHQHALGFVFLHDGGNQTLRVKFQFVVKAHATVNLPPRRKGTKLKLGRICWSNCVCRRD